MPFAKGKSGNPGGKPKGTKHQSTITKEQAREAFRLKVMEQLEPLIEAQIANAKGIKYMMARSKKGGQFKRVTEEMAQAYADGTLSQEDDLIEIWEKDPNVSAFSDMMNRCLDKPKEQPQDLNVTMTNLDQRIKAARERLGKSS